MIKPWPVCLSGSSKPGFIFLRGSRSANCCLVPSCVFSLRHMLLYFFVVDVIFAVEVFGCEAFAIRTLCVMIAGYNYGCYIFFVVNVGVILKCVRCELPSPWNSCSMDVFDMSIFHHTD